MKISNSKRNAKVAAAAVAAGAAMLTAACALAVTASAQPAPARTASIAAAPSLRVIRIAYGEKLHHKFRPDGKGTARTAALSSPDDIAQLGKDIFVNFQ